MKASKRECGDQVKGRGVREAKMLRYALRNLKLQTFA